MKLCVSRKRCKYFEGTEVNKIPMKRSKQLFWIKPFAPQSLDLKHWVTQDLRCLFMPPKITTSPKTRGWSRSWYFKQLFGWCSKPPHIGTYPWWKKYCTTWDEGNLVNLNIYNGVIYQTQLVSRMSSINSIENPANTKDFLGNVPFFSGQAPWRQEIHPKSWGNHYIYFGCFIWTLVNPILNPCTEAIFWWDCGKKYAKYWPKWHTRVTATTWSLEPSLLYKDRPWQAKVSRLMGVKEFFRRIRWLLLLYPSEKNSHLVFWTELTWKLTFLFEEWPLF